MKYGISETANGFSICILQEDGTPLMFVTEPFEYEYQAEFTLRVLQAEQRSELASLIADSFRRAKILEPLEV